MLFWEPKWLEDLVCVAEKGHFARAAEARHVTQSALSRRIKSLEVWVGAELLDRSQHPITPTPAGKEFIPVAREIVERSYEGRTHAAELNRLADSGVAISCLHTLALHHVPILCPTCKNLNALKQYHSLTNFISNQAQKTHAISAQVLVSPSPLLTQSWSFLKPVTTQRNFGDQPTG